MKKLLLLILCALSLNSVAQTTSWSSSPPVTIQTRILTGSPQVRIIWTPSYIFSLSDSLARKANSATTLAGYGITDASAALGNLSNLQAYTGATNTVHVRDTLRGGTFVYVSTTLVPDSGTVFPATGRGSGYWKRQFIGNLKAQWFGTKGDGTTNDTAPLQLAINAAYNGALDAKQTAYSVTGLTIKSYTTLNWGLNTNINLANGANNYILKNQDTTGNTNITVTGGIYNGNYLNQTKYTDATTASGGLWTNGTIHGTYTGYGIFFLNCSYIDFQATKIANTAAWGFAFINGNYIKVHDITFDQADISPSGNADGASGWGSNCEIWNITGRTNDDLIGIGSFGNFIGANNFVFAIGDYQNVYIHDINPTLLGHTIATLRPVAFQVPGHIAKNIKVDRVSGISQYGFRVGGTTLYGNGTFVDLTFNNFNVTRTNTTAEFEIRSVNITNLYINNWIKSESVNNGLLIRFITGVIAQNISVSNANIYEHSSTHSSTLGTTSALLSVDNNTSSLSNLFLKNIKLQLDSTVDRSVIVKLASGVTSVPHIVASGLQLTQTSADPLDLGGGHVSWNNTEIPVTKTNLTPIVGDAILDRTSTIFQQWDGNTWTTYAKTNINNNFTAGQSITDTSNPLLTVGNSTASSTELITNQTDRDFSGPNNWTSTGGWIFTAGLATHTPGSANAATLPNANLTSASIKKGRYYVITATFSSHTASSYIVGLGGGTQNIASSGSNFLNGTFYAVVQAGADNADLTIVPGTTADGSFTNISVKQVLPTFNISNNGNIYVNSNANLLQNSTAGVGGIPNGSYLLSLNRSYVGQGTITVTAGGTTVNGTNTNFLTEYNPGDIIYANGEAHTITAVGNYSLTTDAWTNAYSGSYNTDMKTPFVFSGRGQQTILSNLAGGAALSIINSNSAAPGGTIQGISSVVSTAVTTATSSQVSNAGVFNMSVLGTNNQNLTNTAQALTTVVNIASVTSGATGIISRFGNNYSTFANSASGVTITDGYINRINSFANNGTITNMLGYNTPAFTGTITNQTHFLIGATTLPSGSWAINNQSGLDNNFGTGVSIFGGRARLKSYTVATLPAGTQGDLAYVTDALAPSFLVTVVGGGSTVAPVFYNGTNWVAQ